MTDATTQSLCEQQDDAQQRPCHMPSVTQAQLPYSDHPGNTQQLPTPLQPMVPAYLNMTPEAWQGPGLLHATTAGYPQLPSGSVPYNPLVTPIVRHQYPFNVNTITGQPVQPVPLLGANPLMGYQPLNLFGGINSDIQQLPTYPWVPASCYGTPYEAQLVGHEQQPPPLVSTVPGWLPRQHTPGETCEVPWLNTRQPISSIFHALQPIQELNCEIMPTQVLVVYKSDLSENLISIRRKSDMVRHRNSSNIKKLKNRLRMIRFESNKSWRLFDLGEISAAVDIHKINLYTEILSSQQIVKRFPKMRVLTLIRKSKSELLPSDKDYYYNIIISDYKNSYTVWLNDWFKRVVAHATTRDFEIRSWADIDSFIIYHLHGHLLSELQENLLFHSGGRIGIREEIVRSFPTLRLLKSYINIKFELTHFDVQYSSLELERPSDEFCVESDEKSEHISQKEALDFILLEWLSADNYTGYEEVMGT